MADFRDDIEKYRNGELTPAQMHALERQALNDPFLADALEGTEGMDAAHLSADLRALEHSLRERTEKNRVIPLWRWTMRIAAGLLLLVVSTFVVYRVLDRPDSKNLALQQPETPAPSAGQAAPPATDTVTTPATEDAGMPGADAGETSAPKPAARERHDAASTGASTPLPAPVEQEESRAALAQAEPAPDSDAAAEAIADDAAAKRKLDETPVSAQDGFYNSKARKEEAKVQKRRDSVYAYHTRPQATAPAAGAARQGSVAPKRLVRGKVTSEDGVGLPGVNVIISGTNTGTVTDTEGNYQIPLEEMQQGLMFSFIGMTSKEVDAGASGPVNVVLEPDVSQLSEVVVVGYGAELPDVPKPTYELEFAAPEGGRGAFKKYLENSMRYPQQALDNKVEGRVTIQFTVETNGSLSDFKVLKGIGYGCDEEVIRLVKKGPKWMPTKRDEEPAKDKVKVRLRFRLPRK